MPVHDNDVKGGEGVGGHVPRLVTVHPVHLGTVHGSGVNLEFAMECACGRAESVLPGDLWLIGRVPGIVMTGTWALCHSLVWQVSEEMFLLSVGGQHRQWVVMAVAPSSVVLHKCLVLILQ